MVGTHKDITARRVAAATLAASESVARRQLAELEAVYGGAPVGLAFVGADLRYVRVNDRLATLNGVPPTGHVGRTPAEVTPALAPFLEPLLRGVLATGQPVRGLEFRTEAPGEPGAVRLAARLPPGGRRQRYHRRRDVLGGGGHGTQARRGGRG